MCVECEHTGLVEGTSWLAEMSEGEIRDLRVVVENRLREVEESFGCVLVEAKLPPSVDMDVSRQYRTVNRLSKELETGKISRDDFMSGMQTGIHKNFESAYAKGKGVKISDLTDGDREYLRRAVDTEMKFAGGFADDLKAGVVGKGGKMSRVGRVRMWGETTEGLAWAGRTEGQPDTVIMDWVLGDAEHCPDCLLLAASGPYTKLTLPTYPKSGQTQCRTRCRCHLRYRTGKPSKADRDQAAELGYKKEAPLSELLNPPLPKGFRRPLPNEQKYIDRKRNEINYHRRLIARGGLGDDALKDAVMARKAANAELTEFVNQQNIFEVPVFSVDDVINESHLGRRARRDIARHGLDGGTLDLVDAKLLQRLLNDYENAVGTTFSDDAIAAGLFEAVARKSITWKRIKFVAVPYTIREKSETVSWNLVADTLENTHRLLARVAKVARGTGVIVGPFDDEILSRVGVWLEGDPKVVEEVIKKTRKAR